MKKKEKIVVLGVALIALIIGLLTFTVCESIEKGVPDVLDDTETSTDAPVMESPEQGGEEIGTPNQEPDKVEEIGADNPGENESEPIGSEETDQPAEAQKQDDEEKTKPEEPGRAENQPTVPDEKPQDPPEHVHSDSCLVWVVDTPAKPAVTENRWVIDQPAQEEVTKEVWVVDVPATQEKWEDVWIVDEPAKDAIFMDIPIYGDTITVFYACDQDTGEKWKYYDRDSANAKMFAVGDATRHTTSVLITYETPIIGYENVQAEPARPEVGHFEHVKVSEAAPEQGHYETQIVTPAREEVGHWADVVVTPAQEEKGHYVCKEGYPI